MIESLLYATVIVKDKREQYYIFIGQDIVGIADMSWFSWIMEQNKDITIDQ